MHVEQAPAGALLLTSPQPDRAERSALGRAQRKQLPLEAHAMVPAQAARRDSLALLRSQEDVREPLLIPLRYERMASNPFSYLRGAAIVMASDLGLLPRTTLETQLCGDAHVANFGIFASAEGHPVFDLNDFDETLRGPFEWDVKRLGASIVIAGQWLDLSEKSCRRAALAATRAYRKTMAKLAELTAVEAWSAHVQATELTGRLRHTALSKALAKASKKARTRTSETATLELTEKAGGSRRFRNAPPLLQRIPEQDRDTVLEGLAIAYRDYSATVPPDVVRLLEKFSFIDVAFKVVGVGSVGTRALLLLLETGDGDPLMLQLKQAGRSVVEPYAEPSPFTNQGRRVVMGQKAIQVSGDPFLGWFHGGEQAPYDFYVRQLQDNKGSIDLAKLDKESLPIYAALCGGALARAHGRAGDAATLSGYLGHSSTFDNAIADFARGYAQINAYDSDALSGSNVRAATDAATLPTSPSFPPVATGPAASSRP